LQVVGANTRADAADDRQVLHDASVSGCRARRSGPDDEYAGREACLRFAGAQAGEDEKYKHAR
jgi:hypothetical protein